jgi:IS30 family transposase
MTDRVSERRRAAQLARHYRLTIAEIARRLGRAAGTVKAYLYDPIGEKARQVKARYRGVRRFRRDTEVSLLWHGSLLEN